MTNPRLALEIVEALLSDCQSRLEQVELSDTLPPVPNADVMDALASVHSAKLRAQAALRHLTEN